MFFFLFLIALAATLCSEAELSRLLPAFLSSFIFVNGEPLRLSRLPIDSLSLFILSLEPLCLDVDLLLGEADALFLFDGVVDRLLGGEPPGL